MSVTTTCTLVAERYSLDRLIACGGMGEVWRATDVLLQRTVAVKMLKPEYAGDATFLQRFRNEARSTAVLSHPGIAALYDYGEMSDDDGRAIAYLVMELVDGEPLSDLLAREGRLPVARALDVVAQVADALHAAHRAGVVHRDVKPANLLVRPDGVVKITDFGIAWAGSSVPLTDTGSIMGTAHYVSPEQVTGKPATPASDVYSLGVVAHECLSGARPFLGTNPVAIALAHVREEPPPLPRAIPLPVRELISSALAKDPEGRPTDSGAFARDAAALRDAPAGPSAGTTPADGTTADVPAPDATTLHPTSSAAAGPPPPAPVTSRIPAARAGTPRRRSGRTVATGASVLAAAALGTLLLIPSTATEPQAVAADPSPRASTATVAAPAPARVLVDARRFEGRPVAEVRAVLTAMGLRPVVTGSGTATAVSPSGWLPLRSSISVRAVEPAAARAVAPASTAVSETTTVETRGKAKGATKGKGRR